MTDTNTPLEDPSRDRAGSPSSERREQLEAALAEALYHLDESALAPGELEDWRRTISGSDSPEIAATRLVRRIVGEAMAGWKGREAKIDDAMVAAIAGTLLQHPVTRERVKRLVAGLESKSPP